MTWVETFMPSSGGFTGFKVPQKWPQEKKTQNYKVIDWWREEEKEHNCSWGAGTNERKMRFPSTLVRLIPNGFSRGGFREAAYLAAEFAVLKAMQGENNKKRQQPSFTAEWQRRNDIQNKRWIHRVGVRSQALKCAKSVLAILALTDISGSFLPPLLGEFLPLLWAHRVCSEKGRNFSSVFLSWTCSNRFFKPKAQRWCTFILKGGSFTLEHQVSSKQNLNKLGWPNIFLKLHAR